MTLVPSVPAAVRVMDVSQEGQMLLALLFPQRRGCRSTG